MFSQMSSSMIMFFLINSYKGLAEIWLCLNGMNTSVQSTFYAFCNYFLSQPHHVACLVWRYQYKLIAIV